MSMTKQEIFDEVVSKLRTQGKPSYSVDAQMCMYRGPDGLKCAVGHLLLDNEYHPNMEGKNFKDFWQGPIKDRLGEDNDDLLNRLVSVHDNEISSGGWEHGWQEVAEEYNLVYTPPNKG